MNNIYKYISYLSIGILISFFAQCIESDFINSFSANVISLLATILAINIASSSIIASKLREVILKTGGSFEKTKSELKTGLQAQLFLIAIAFIILILKDSKFLVLHLDKNHIDLFTNSIILGIFIFYLDVIYDLGKSMFTLFTNKDIE